MKIHSKIYFVLLLALILGVFSLFQIQETSSNENNGRYKQTWTVKESNLECIIAPYGKTMEEIMDFQDFILGHLMLIQQHTNNTVVEGKGLHSLIEICQEPDKLCQRYCDCACVPCCDDCPPMCVVCGMSCRGEPCPPGREEILKRIIFETDQSITHWEAISPPVFDFKREVNRFRDIIFKGGAIDNLYDIESAFEELYPKRIEERISVYSCYEAKARKIVTHCPSENDYYICKPMEK